MRQKILIVAPLLLLFVTTSASAMPVLARSAAPDKPKDRSTEIAIAMLIGGADVGEVSGGGVGVQLTLGRRFGDVTVSGEFAYLGISHSNDNEPEGTIGRAGVIGRYTIFGFGGDKAPIMGRLWMEAGLGVQRVTWNKGGILTRPDLALGFGFSWAGVINRRKPTKKKTIGWFVGIRTHIARAPRPTVAVAPTCAGPCDRATGPARDDVSVMANFGFHWGRY